MSARMGQPFMPWQQQVADVGGELMVLPSGLVVPAYREVIVTVPRQSGKTTLVLSWMIQRAHGWGGPQRMAYTAQTGNDARKKLVEDWVPMLRPRLAKVGIRRIFQGMGNEGVDFHNGSRIVLLASSEEAGHGKTIHFAAKDELFADSDFRRDQALIPAMSTIDEAQTLTSSTAGTDTSVALNDAVARGRQAVLEGRREGVAYFEWSAGEDDDLDDPGCWWSFMPALGFTQSERTIAHSRENQPAGEFRRAFGNVATVSAERVIPSVAWEACLSLTVAPVGSVTFGVDVNLERTGAAIAMADSDGRVELLEHGVGTGWLAGRVADLAAKTGSPVAIDPAGPAGGLMADPLLQRVQFVEIGGRLLGQACASFYDDVMSGRAQIRRHASLDSSVAGSRKRTVGDTWVWARKDLTTDTSPLVAATLARWAAMHRKAAPPPNIF